MPADVDAAHDFSHVLRVARSAEHIARAEGADVPICVGAALLHELFNYPKGHPGSALSGDVCADRARALLLEIGWPEAAREAIAYAIRVHSFSRGRKAETLEARVLQDADRLDAIGAIGIARCFATCQSMGRPFYRPDDPLCAAREPEDKLWGVDHFYKKLLRIAPGLHTEAARAIAAPRVQMMEDFLRQLGVEIGIGSDATLPRETP